MKSSPYLFCIIVSLIFFQCNVEGSNQCEDLRSGLLNYNVEIAQPIIDDILDKLQPNPDVDDMRGHQDNLYVFKERLTEGCDYITAVGCYACIYTFPPYSEIIVSLDSAGLSVNRTLDIVTPEGEVMRLGAIHP